MTNAVRYYEDPSIAKCCAVEYDRLWSIIEAGTIRDSFYIAREKVLAYEIPRISRLYGPVVAHRVSKAIQWRSPDSVSEACKEALSAKSKAWADAHQAQKLEAELAKRGGKLLWVDRLWIRILGYPFTF
ncbi:hypothetical protein [Alsobacter sp. SYSU BS001988]